MQQLSNNSKTLSRDLFSDFCYAYTLMSFIHSCVLAGCTPKHTQHNTTQQNTFPFPYSQCLSSNIYTMSLFDHLIFLSKMVPSKLMEHVFLFFFLTTLSIIPVSSLNIGVQTTGITISVSKECSRECESRFCSVPALLRYGKYRGILYSGCPGEKPCDDFDACCMNHDLCVQAKNNDYLSQECSQAFINCMNKFKNRRGPTFKGNTCEVDDVIQVISVVMEAAMLAGRVLHKP